MLKLPQIITDNLNVKLVNTFFELLNMITDSHIKDERMDQFLLALNDNDGEDRHFDKRKKGTITINESYSQLSLLQKKIVNRTFETAIMVSNTKSISEKYLREMEKIVKNELT